MNLIVKNLQSLLPSTFPNQPSDSWLDVQARYGYAFGCYVIQAGLTAGLGTWAYQTATQSPLLMTSQAGCVIAVALTISQLLKVGFEWHQAVKESSHEKIIQLLTIKPILYTSLSSLAIIVATVALGVLGFPQVAAAAGIAIAGNNWLWHQIAYKSANQSQHYYLSHANAPDETIRKTLLKLKPLTQVASMECDLSHSQVSDQTLVLLLSILLNQSAKQFKVILRLNECQNITLKGIKRLLQQYPSLQVILTGTPLDQGSISQLQSLFPQAYLENISFKMKADPKDPSSQLIKFRTEDWNDSISKDFLIRRSPVFEKLLTPYSMIEPVEEIDLVPYFSTLEAKAIYEGIISGKFPDTPGISFQSILEGIIGYEIPELTHQVEEFFIQRELKLNRDNVTLWRSFAEANRLPVLLSTCVSFLKENPGISENKEQVKNPSKKPLIVDCSKSNWSLSIQQQQAKHLILKKIKNYAKLLELLPTCTQLESLELEHAKLSHDTLFTPALSSRLEAFKNLKALSFKNCTPLKDYSFSKLVEKNSKLERLEVSGCIQLTDAALKDLAQNCPQLKSLNINNCIKIKEEGLRAVLKRAVLFEELSLVKCSHLNFENLFTELSTIQSLDLSGCTQLTPLQINSILAKSPCLTKINLKDCEQLSVFYLEKLKLRYPRLTVTW